MKPATSSRPCRESAASCSPAIQPSVRACKAATCSAESESPITSRRKAVVSSKVKRKLAATPLGQQVRAIAELIEIDGRRLVFKVEAHDEKRKIGEGQHERYIVNLERFMKRIGQ